MNKIKIIAAALAATMMFGGATAFAAEACSNNDAPLCSCMQQRRCDVIDRY